MLSPGSVRIALNPWTPWWCPRMLGDVGKKTQIIWWPEVKCFVWVVKETHRKERHSREELGFSFYRRWKTEVFHCTLHVEYLTKRLVKFETSERFKKLCLSCFLKGNYYVLKKKMLCKNRLKSQYLVQQWSE